MVRGAVTRCGHLLAVSLAVSLLAVSLAEEQVRETGQDVVVKSEDGKRVCVYANSPWSDCDPVSLRRSKSVQLKSGPGPAGQFGQAGQTGQTGQNGQAGGQGGECPQTRQLTVGCSLEDLPRGTQDLIQENGRLRLQVRSLTLENEQLRQLVNSHLGQGTSIATGGGGGDQMQTPTGAANSCQQLLLLTQQQETQLRRLTIQRENLRRRNEMFRTMLRRVRQKLHVYNAQIATFARRYGQARQRWAKAEQERNECRRTQIRYEALLGRARLELRAFMSKLFILRSSYLRLLDDVHQQRIPVTQHRINYIFSELNRTQSELTRLRAATVSLISVYKLCHSHVTQLEAENNHCHAALDTRRTQMQAQAGSYQDLYSNDHHSPSLYEQSPYLGYGTPDGNPKCQLALSQTMERLRQLVNYYHRFIRTLKRDTMRMSMVQLNNYIRKALSAYKRSKRLHHAEKLELERRLVDCKAVAANHLSRCTELCQRETSALQGSYLSNEGSDRMHSNYLRCRQQLAEQMRAYSNLLLNPQSHGYGQNQIQQNSCSTSLNLCHRQFFHNSNRLGKAITSYRKLYGVCSSHQPSGYSGYNGYLRGLPTPEALERLSNIHYNSHYGALPPTPPPTPTPPTCQKQLDTCRLNATNCANLNVRKTLVIVYLRKKIRRAEMLLKRGVAAARRGDVAKAGGVAKAAGGVAKTGSYRGAKAPYDDGRLNGSPGSSIGSGSGSVVDGGNMLSSEAPFWGMVDVDGGGEGGQAGSAQNPGVPSPHNQSLGSQSRLMKILVAEMVLKNANLTNEIYVLRRLLHQYELATGQDLLSLMHWFVSQLNIPLKKIRAVSGTEPGKMGLGSSNGTAYVVGTVPVVTTGTQGGNGTSGTYVVPISDPGAPLPPEVPQQTQTLDSGSPFEDQIYGPISSIVSRFQGSHHAQNTSRKMLQMLQMIQDQVDDLKRFTEKRERDSEAKMDHDRLEITDSLNRLSNETYQLGSRFEDEARKTLFGPRHVTYSEYEILQHQKEELELQNRRLVERISKLKYILKAASHKKNARLESLFRLLGRELSRLEVKIQAIIDRYIHARQVYAVHKGYTRDYAQRMFELVVPIQEEMAKVMQSVRQQTIIPIYEHSRLANLTAVLEAVEALSRNISQGGVLGDVADLAGLDGQSQRYSGQSTLKKPSKYGSQKYSGPGALAKPNNYEQTHANESPQYSGPSTLTKQSKYEQTSQNLSPKYSGTLMKESKYEQPSKYGMQKYSGQSTLTKSSRYEPQNAYRIKEGAEGHQYLPDKDYAGNTIKHPLDQMNTAESKMYGEYLGEKLGIGSGYDSGGSDKTIRNTDPKYPAYQEPSSQGHAGKSASNLANAKSTPEKSYAEGAVGLAESFGNYAGITKNSAYNTGNYVGSSGSNINVAGYGGNTAAKTGRSQDHAEDYFKNTGNTAGNSGNSAGSGRSSSNTGEMLHLLNPESNPDVPVVDIDVGATSKTHVGGSQYGSQYGKIAGSSAGPPPPTATSDNLRPAKDYESLSNGLYSGAVGAPQRPPPTAYRPAVTSEPQSNSRSSYLSQDLGAALSQQRQQQQQQRQKLGEEERTYRRRDLGLDVDDEDFKPGMPPPPPLRPPPSYAAAAALPASPELEASSALRATMDAVRQRLSNKREEKWEKEASREFLKREEGEKGQKGKQLISPTFLKYGGGGTSVSGERDGEGPASDKSGGGGKEEEEGGGTMDTSDLDIQRGRPVVSGLFSNGAGAGADEIDPWRSKEKEEKDTDSDIGGWGEEEGEGDRPTFDQLKLPSSDFVPSLAPAHEDNASRALPSLSLLTGAGSRDYIQPLGRAPELREESSSFEAREEGSRLEGKRRPLWDLREDGAGRSWDDIRRSAEDDHSTLF